LDIWVLPLDGEQEPAPFLTTPADEDDATLSPDGRWIAYVSDETGVFQVYVQPFPGPGGKYQVSVNEGRFPRWTNGGRELIYVERPSRWMAVSVSIVGDTFRSEKPELLFEGNFGGSGSWPQYDVSADGERFIVFPRPDQEAGDALVTLVFDFFTKSAASPPNDLRPPQWCLHAQLICWPNRPKFSWKTGSSHLSFSCFSLRLCAFASCFSASASHAVARLVGEAVQEKGDVGIGGDVEIKESRSSSPHPLLSPFLFKPPTVGLEPLEEELLVASEPGQAPDFQNKDGCSGPSGSATLRNTG
jgi:hypothetical protein